MADNDKPSFSNHSQMVKTSEVKLNGPKQLIERAPENLDSMSNRDTEVNEQYNENSSHDEIPSCEEPTTDYDKLEFVKAIDLSPTHTENENRERTKNISADELADGGFKICLKMVDSGQGIVGERVHFASPIAVHYDYSQSQSTLRTQTLDQIDSQSSEQTEVYVHEELQRNTADEKSGAKSSVDELVLENSSQVESIEHLPSDSAFSVNDMNTFILDQQDNCSWVEIMKSTDVNNDNNSEEINMIHSDEGKLSDCEGGEVNSDDYQRASIPVTITGSIKESIIEKCFQSGERSNSNFVLDNFIARTEDGVKRDNEVQSLLKTGHTDESFKLGQKDRYADFKIGNSSQINVSIKDMDCMEIVNVLNPLGQETDNLDNNADITTSCNRQQIISSDDEDSAYPDAFNSSQQIICSALNNSESANTFNPHQQNVSSEKECRSEYIKIHNPQEQNEDDLYLPGVHYGSKAHISVPTNEDIVICKLSIEKGTQDPQLSCYGIDIDTCEKQNQECKVLKSVDCKQDYQNDSRVNLQMDHTWPSIDATEKCPHTKSLMNKIGNIDKNLDVSLEVTVISPGKNLDGKAENHNSGHSENVKEKPKFDGISVNSFREQLKFSIPKYSCPHDDETEIITPDLTNGGEFIQSQDPEVFNKSQTPRHLLQVTIKDCDTNRQNVSENNCKSLNAVAEAECITETNQHSDGSKAIDDEDMRDIKPGIAENISFKKQKIDNSYQKLISDHDATLVVPLRKIGGFKSNTDHADDSVVPQIASYDKRHISQSEDVSDWPEKRMKLENILYSANEHGQILSKDDLMDENQISLLHKCLTNPSVPKSLENYETTLPKFHIAEVSMESSGGELSIQPLIEAPGFISTKDYLSSQESMGSSHGFSIHLSQEEQLELSPQTMDLASNDMVEKIKDQAVPVDLDVGDHLHPSELLDSKVELEPILFYDDHPERTYKSQECCFKWKYTPSCNLDEGLPTECDSNQQDMMATVKSLVTCARPFRVGLSKRQRVDHLHRSPRK
ncbi:hypothetical protein CHS0354_019030 [Potamilus streckersoni]|uniref:Uncharacterized protein n=1 Tax=Potamilus streckersoni TaxID=2493646 RepID=A0AAE0VSI7_9BIVA|nr:hypothetical protein CHS0354_019030 [Potamilus streckersoni]